jgi:hypothetical protein
LNQPTFFRPDDGNTGHKLTNTAIMGQFETFYAS